MMTSNETILAIDVGNTNIHWSFITNGQLQEYKRNRHTELSLLPWDEVEKNKYTVVIAGTLPHINDSIITIANDHKVKSLEINASSQSIIKNTYSTLGIDRVCNLIAAFKSFENLKLPIVVFDFGTGTTATSCDQNGDFLGGIIKTGCEIELKALSSKTFALPHVELAKEQKITKLTPFARNTEDAMLHGVISGQVALVNYYLRLFKEHVKANPKIVFTGGNAPIINRFLDKKCDLYDPHLTIKGIYYCYQASLVKHP